MGSYGKANQCRVTNGVNTSGFTSAAGTGSRFSNIKRLQVHFEVPTENNSEIAGVQMEGSSTVSDEGSWIANICSISAMCRAV